MDDAAMTAENPAVDMNNLAGPDRIGLEALDQLAVATLRDEADILTVGLVGDHKTEVAGQDSRFRLVALAERKTQHGELVRRRRVEEVALVTIGVGGTEQGTRAIRQRA